jgi:hypothetical protein
MASKASKSLNGMEEVERKADWNEKTPESDETPPLGEPERSLR